MYGQGNEPELLDPGIDVLLIFPPVTEARLFPYLSLPMITSYLKRAGVRTAQVDLNLALSMRLFSSECLAEYRELADQGRLNPRLSSEALPGEVRRLWLPYRRELSTFLLEHRDSLARCAFDTKHHPQFGTDAALRLVRLGMELLLEGSSLVAHARSIPALEFMAGQAADADGSIAARQLRALVHELLERMTPRLLAVSIAFYSQIAPSLMIARWAKELFPELCVVFGGQQIMLRHEEFAASSGFRRWVNGLGTADGEETLLALHHTLLGQEKSEAIPNFIWLNRSKSPDEIRVVTGNLNERPTPDFSGLAIRSYLSDEVQLPLITCVGCYWGRCCFCSYGNRSRRERNYRQLSPDVLAGHCRSLVDRYGVSRINFVDENTNLNLILRAMRVLNNQGYRIRFSTRNRLEASLSDESFCRELRQRGCVLMSAGYETNSQRLLDLIDKGVSARHYQQIVDNLHRVGIPLRLSILGGILDETDEELRSSRDFLVQNAAKIGIDVMQMLVAEPKTYLVERSELFPIHLDRKGELRGNDLLNYGMGRVGYAFSYPDGESYTERLRNFLSIYQQVEPGKNDEQRPRTGSQDSIALVGSVAPQDLRLLPWVRVLSLPNESGGENVLSDVLWERFYSLPPWVKLDTQRGTLRVESDDPTRRVLLTRLAKQGFGHLKPVG